MHLKRLELQGFKSFPEKVRLEFGKGITAVVGPNGSGKSNISDSVRWVLGEQRVKSLRGDKMEDVIFAGTQNRKALGFAEVSITIDNQDGKLPIAFSEVTVKRRVFRSGDSDYLINGTACRLKDVHELFMDTGIGREGYSIIGQGRIDEILNAKGEERRRLFEEAAGIVKYKNRKLEAQGKLEREQQNLTRVDDILGELSLQVGPLQEQSETAKAYLRLKEEMKTAEVQLFLLQMEKIREAQSALSENQKIAAEQQQSEEALYEQEKEKGALLRKETEVFAEAVQRINDEMAEIRTALEKKEGTIGVLCEQAQHLETDRQRLLAEMSKSRQKAEECLTQASLCDAKISGVEVSVKVERERLQEAEEAFSALSAKLYENESQLETYQSDMIEKIKVTTDVKGELSRTEAMLEQFSSRMEQLKKEKAYLLSQLDGNRVHKEAVKKKTDGFLQEEAKAKQEAVQLEEKIQKEQKALSELSAGFWNKNKELAEKNSKFRVLSEMEKAHDGFYKSVREVLNQKKNGHPRFQGILGAVGELLTVEERLETAIEIALGSSIQNIVTENEQDAKHAISYLKEKHLGRATFLPLSSVKGRTFGSEKEKLLAEKGVIGIAKDLISYDKQFEGVVTSLLGRVLVMEDLDNAILLAKKYGFTHRIVTLSGDVLSPGGAMTGGSLAKKVTNVFGRSREIKELEEELAALETLLQQKQTEMDAKKQAISGFTDKAASLEETKRALQMNILSAKQDLEQTKAGMQEQEEKIRYYEIEEKQLQEQLDAANGSHMAQKASLSNMEQDISMMDEKLLSFQNSMEGEKAEKDTLLGEITELKISLSNHEQSKEAVLLERERVFSEKKNLEEEIVECAAKLEAVQKEKADKQAALLEMQELLSVERGQISDKQEELTKKAQERKRMLAETGELEEQMQGRFETISKLKNELFRLDTQKEKLKEEESRLYNTLWEEYEMTYQMAKEYKQAEMPKEELARFLKHAKAKIREMGSVNVEAIETYKEVKGRLEFLTAQRDDIIEAEKRLLDIIKDLTALMEAQFTEQFALISKNFNQVFQEMFGGGKAYLKLADEQNVLESGIEIIAQPPGKNLQNMTLLSGGERALTAIAILFSILKIKPSPFCILDEIEAALDDANVARFANYLKRFSGDTQFIVITHRKGTMESADVMYGVTMQEQGISKLLSVKFNEEAVS